MRRTVLGLPMTLMTLTVLAVCLALAVGSGTWSALASTPRAQSQAAPAEAVPVPLVQIAPTNVITASARGEVEVAPDMARVTMGAVVSNTTAQGAQDGVNTIISRTLSALQALNIAQSQISTINLSIVPHYSDANTISGYTASQILSVVVTSVHRVGLVVDAGVKAGATANVSVAYGLSDSNSAYLQALNKGTRTAASHAGAMAAALGKSLATAKVESSESGPVVDHRTPTTITSPGGLLDFRVDVTLSYQF